MEKIIHLEKDINITNIQEIYDKIKSNLNSKFTFDFKNVITFDACFLQLLVFIKKNNDFKIIYKNVKNELKLLFKRYGYIFV